MLSHLQAVRECCYKFEDVTAINRFHQLREIIYLVMLIVVLRDHAEEGIDDKYVKVVKEALGK